MQLKKEDYVLINAVTMRPIEGLDIIYHATTIEAGEEFVQPGEILVSMTELPDDLQNEYLEYLKKHGEVTDSNESVPYWSHEVGDKVKISDELEGSGDIRILELYADQTLTIVERKKEIEGLVEHYYIEDATGNKIMSLLLPSEPFPFIDADLQKIA